VHGSCSTQLLYAPGPGDDDRYVAATGQRGNVSGGGDQGADPNKLVTITDQVNATSAPSGESFQTVQSAGSGQVLRGVSVTPGTRPAATDRNVMGRAGDQLAGPALAGVRRTA